MGFEEVRKESFERYKVKRFHFWVTFFGVFFLASVFFYAIDTKNFSLSSMFLYLPTANPLWFFIMFFIFLSVWFYWYGNKFNALMKKIGIYNGLYKYIYKPLDTALNIVLPSNISEFLSRVLFKTDSKIDELEKFFYKAPVKDDAIEKVPLNKFKVFKGKYSPYTLFDFSEKGIGIEDKEGTNRIIEFFRGDNFDEKSERYIDLFCVLEGKFKGWGNDVTFKDIPTPFVVQKDKNGNISKIETDISRDVYNPVDDEVAFSVKMLRDTIEIATFMFMRFIERSLRGGTKIRRLYGSMLRKEEVRRKFIDIFKFFMFRRLLLNYGSIPSGWVVIRADDYDFRKIASNIDRSMVISIRDTNKGIGDSPDDRFASMFLFVWHAFFEKSSVSHLMQDVLWCFDPLKSLTDVKLKREIDINEESVRKVVEQEQQGQENKESDKG